MPGTPQRECASRAVPSIPLRISHGIQRIWYLEPRETGALRAPALLFNRAVEITLAAAAVPCIRGRPLYLGTLLYGRGISSRPILIILRARSCQPSLPGRGRILTPLGRVGRRKGKWPRQACPGHARASQNRFLNQGSGINISMGMQIPTLSVL